MSSIEPEVALPERRNSGGSLRARALRFAGVMGLALGVLGFLLVRRGVHAGTGVVLLGAAALLPALALLRPRAALAVEAAWVRFAAALGRVNAALLLTALYIVVVTPLGLLFRIRNRGSFGVPPTGSTFTPRKGARDPKHFERAF